LCPFAKGRKDVSLYSEFLPDAKEILAGKETTVIGHLSKTEGKLGRSLVIDLPSKGYKQVDHRTLKWLIIRNVKYSVKK
jgi:hypothetical protein